MIITIHIALLGLLMIASGYFAVGLMMAWAIRGAGADWVDLIRYFFLWPILEGGFKAMRVMNAPEEESQQDDEKKP